MAKPLASRAMNAKNSSSTSRSQLDNKAMPAKQPDATKVVFKRQFSVKSLSTEERMLALELLTRKVL